MGGEPKKKPALLLRLTIHHCFYSEQFRLPYILTVSAIHFAVFGVIVESLKNQLFAEIGCRMPEQEQINELAEVEATTLEMELAAHKASAERANLHFRAFIVILILLGIAVSNIANKAGYCQANNWPSLLQSCDAGRVQSP